MFQRKKKCDVCGYRFALKKEDVYTVEEPRSFVECLSKPPTRYSVIDCPKCGCQIALAIRSPRVGVIADLNDRDDMEESEAAAGEPKICAGGCVHSYADPPAHCRGCEFENESEVGDNA